MGATAGAARGNRMSYEEVPKWQQRSFMIAKLGTGSAYVAVLAAIFVAAAIPLRTHK